MFSPYHQSDFKLIIGFNFIPKFAAGGYSASFGSTTTSSRRPDLSRYRKFQQILYESEGAFLQRLPRDVEEKICLEAREVVLMNRAFSSQNRKGFEVYPTQLFQVQAPEKTCRKLARQLFTEEIASKTWVKAQTSNPHMNNSPLCVASVFRDGPARFEPTISKFEEFCSPSLYVEWPSIYDATPIGIVDDRYSGSPYILLHIKEDEENRCGAVADKDALWGIGFEVFGFDKTNTAKNIKVWDIGVDTINTATNKTILRVHFLEGSLYLQQKVRKYAQCWEIYTCIKFQFVESGYSEIRVAFDKHKGSWSYVGTDCLAIAQYQATMNFGWFDESTSDEEFSRTVLHEFGHALGLVHEHSSPAASIPWKKESVYASYANQDPPWSKELVEHNLFAKYDPSEVYFTNFNSRSIMCYPILKEHTTNGYEISVNNVLSSEDIAFVAKLYPRQGPRTGLHGGSMSKTYSPTVGSPPQQLICRPPPLRCSPPESPEFLISGLAEFHNVGRKQDQSEGEAIEEVAP